MSLLGSEHTTVLQLYYHRVEVRDKAGSSADLQVSSIVTDRYSIQGDQYYNEGGGNHPNLPAGWSRKTLNLTLSYIMVFPPICDAGYEGKLSWGAHCHEIAQNYVCNYTVEAY